ncbi:MAG: AlpA family phage regulatory protein [Nitrospira sp.]|nr:AlpA family phage regulatory protein [Nitrospira sp.]
MATQPTTTDNILRWPDVQARIPISRSHAHALAAKGLFPKPIKICGSRSSGWLESEINAWLAERIADSRINDQEVASGVGI